jgi:DNA-binding GntR family transcriptional regulator
MIYQNGAEALPPDQLGEIRFQSRPEAVAERLREAILSGALKPGERLIEQKLAARFHVGQPTLREALKDLEFQGFVRKAPKKATYVTYLSGEDFQKILEVRLALETLAIFRAVRNLTPGVVEELEQCVRGMESSARQLDLASFHKNDMQFHRRIWDLAGNEHLGAALERVAFGLFAFVLLQRQTGNGNEFIASAAQHKRILEGLRTGDANIARQAFLEHTVRYWNEYHHVSVGIEYCRPDQP